VRRFVAAVAVIALGALMLTSAALAQVLRVGTYKAIPGQFDSVQAAVNAARPGDWILIAPGDYHEAGARMPSGAHGDDRAGAGVLIQTPGLWLRGMDRNAVWVDGTKAGAPRCSSAPADQNLGPIDSAGTPGGRNGILVYKAPGVIVENLSVCNFLHGDLGGGDQIWWDGGASTGTQTNLGNWSGNYLTATSSYFKDDSSPAAGYGIYSSNTKGPGQGGFAHDYASNMNDSAFYVGACPDCNVTLNDVHGEYAPQGYSGTNSGGHVVIENSEFDNNETGFATGDLNNDDAPGPQDGTCPGDAVNPQAPTNIQRTHVCWALVNNYIHDNNNPNVPSSGVAGAAPVGTGITIYGGRHDVITGNRIVNNGAWGVAFVPFPDTEQPPPEAHCNGGADLSTPGSPLCYYDNYGNEFANNTFTHNGFFGNQSNGDIAEVSQAGPNYNADSNCFHDNIDTAGTLTSDPSNIDSRNHCGQTYPAAADPAFTAQVACDSSLVTNCPPLTAANYPRPTKVVLNLPPAQQTMPNPCAGVPANPWCESGAPSCARASGRLTGRGIGPVSLGMTRARARRAFRGFSIRGRRYMDFFCLVGSGIRTGYPSPRLLASVSRAERRRVRGRVVLALTSDRFYALRGIRRGARLASVARKLRTGKRFHIGLNYWYLAPNGPSRAVLKVRHGIIEEIGIADKHLTQNRRADFRFLQSFF
jgi:hypothetical protein